MKYLLKFIFPFFFSAVEDKRGVEFCHSTRNAFRIWQKVGNGVTQCLNTRFPLPTLQCESDLFYYYLVFCKFFPYNLVFVLLKSVRKVTFFQAEGTWEPSVETFRSQCDTCVLYFPPNSQEILC